MLLLSLCVTAGPVRAQCGSLAAPSTTWSNGNGVWGVSGNWTGGTPSASTNACILDGTSTVTLSTNGNALGLQLASGNNLNVNAGQSLNLISGTSLNYGRINNSGGINNISGANFSNYGTLINASGASITVFTSSFVNNSGASLANSGTFNMQDGGVFNAGTINSSGTINLSFPNSQFVNSGTLNNSGAINNNFSNTFVNSGTMNNSGTFTNGAVSPPAFLTNSGTINNSGTIINNLAATLANSGTINNSGTISNAGSFNNSGAFLNYGAVTISSSGLFTTSTNYSQTGGSTLVDGTLTATGSAFVNIQGGTLSGSGTINGNVLMAGTMMPGNAPGTLTIFGNYEQTGSGMFDELIGPSASFLNVNGNAFLDPGAFLEITLLNGFDPLNQTFGIMDYSSLSGQFANGSSFWDDGFLWDITYGQNQIDITAVSTPEPGSLPLLFIGLGVLAFCTHLKMRKTQSLA